MLDATFQGARDLWKEIWTVKEDEPSSPLVRSTALAAERISNLAVVALYAVLVAYLAVLLHRQLPLSWKQAGGHVANNLWFWVGLVLLVITALRFGLDVTKTLKRWRVSQLLASLLLFDFLLKNAPGLFGLSGYSPVDHALGALAGGELGQFVQKALGF